MSSSLFRKSEAQPQQTNDLFSAVNEVRKRIGNQDPNAVLQQMCMQDPQVRAFVNQFRGMNPMQIAAQFFKK